MSAVEVEVFAVAQKAAIEAPRPKFAGASAAPAASHDGVGVHQRIDGIVMGVLIGFAEDGETALVMHPHVAGSTAVAAASIVDLHGPHIGREVVLQFAGGDPARPIVMGVLRRKPDWSLAQQPGQVEVDADGQRLTVGAKEQLVLKCGKASITLTKAGKIVIQGTYVSQRSSGVMRIKGGSVQLN